jgi:hypothetical protein
MLMVADTFLIFGTFGFPFVMFEQMWNALSKKPGV